MDKVRLRFKKGGRLRLLSHHDLLRCFERMLRRAALPVHRTRGFHPHPRLVFALSLPLGVVGREEVAELELDEVIAAEEVLDQLRRQAPEGIAFLSAKRVPLKTTAQVRSLCYRLPLPAGRAAAVRELADSLLASAEVWLARGQPQPGQVPRTAALPDRGARDARVNVRPFLRDLRLVGPDAADPPGSTDALEADLWLTPVGTARPVEVLGLLSLTDLIEAGAVLERTRLELHDEIGP